MMYLKVYRDSELRSLDSCRVTHGKFEFRGVLDTTVMANLFAEDISLMPVVVESGPVVVRIDEQQQSLTGTPLNDSLMSFIRQKTAIDLQIQALTQKEGRLVMSGMEFSDVVDQLNTEYAALSVKGEQLVTQFVKRNYNNVLGPGIFMILTSSLPYPMLTPQIEEILATATPQFLSHPYVRDFVGAAHHNMQQLYE